MKRDFFFVKYKKRYLTSCLLVRYYEIESCDLHSFYLCIAEENLLHCGEKSAALRRNFCCAADELLLHGGRNSAARQIFLCA